VRSLRQFQVEKRLAEMSRYAAIVRKQPHGRDTNFLRGRQSNQTLGPTRVTQIRLA
jgi:hypothetical protein